MRNESAASAGPPALTAFQRRRRRRAAAVFAIVGFSFFLWPLALHELAPLRADTLRLGGIGAAGDAGGGQGGPHGKRRAHAARTVVTAQAAFPSWRGFGLLDALPPGLLSDLQTIPPAEPAISADLPAFGAPASAISSFNPPSLPPGTDQGFPFITTPGGPTPPPVVSLPPVDPPITPPVTPPDNPVTTPDPSVPPPVVPPIAGPPVVGPPIVAPPVGPGGPFLPDPGGPGGGSQGGGPVAGIPEPAVWLEMVLGAGLAGVALRRARLQPATALRARSRA